MIFLIRKMEYSDLEWLRLLRNYERKKFFDTNEIWPEQQESWWRSAQWGDERWVIEVEGDSIAVGYFSIVSPKPDLPVFPTDGRPVRYFSTMIVAPEWRGKGAIAAAVDTFDTRSHCYVGYVKVGNEASLKACAKLGFRQRGVYYHPAYKEIVIVWRD